MNSVPEVKPRLCLYCGEELLKPESIRLRACEGCRWEIAAYLDCPPAVLEGEALTEAEKRERALEIVAP